MVFYKGGVQHIEKDTISIAEIINLRNSAERINREMVKEQKKMSK